MKIYFILLIVTVFSILLVSACNTGQESTTPVIEQTDTPVELVTSTPEFTKTPAPTETTQATPTLAPSPTDMPTATEIISPTTVISETVEPEQPMIGTTRVSESDQMVEVLIPAGEFIMGSDDVDAKKTVDNGRAYPEIPVHTYYLEDYWIDKFEVTNSQYALCVDAGVCDPPYLVKSETRQSYFDNPEYSNYPVIWVSWYMATTYCDWAGRRLPTEAEWEKASRGTDGRKYPWGNEPLKDDPLSGERTNFCDKNCPRDIANDNYDDGFADTAPVGSYPLGASPYGVMDMSGNVWEWTSTIINPYPYDPTDGREDPDKYAERVWRGGPWSNGYWWVRSSVRYRSIPTYWYVNLGFRCASSN